MPGSTPPRIEIEGRRELIRALKQAGENAGALKAVHERVALPLAAAGRLEAPYISGELSGSVRASATQRAVSLKAGGRRVPYAAPIHFGWPARNIRPNPFLYRARDAMADQVVEAYRRHIDDLCERVARESFHG